jgi:hypothetical protein
MTEANPIPHVRHSGPWKTRTLAKAVADAMLKVKKDAVNGCWNWAGYVTARGYGRAQVKARFYPIHRLVWMELRGPIPDGLELDHLCRNRICVNPAHLEPVTNRENNLRGFSPAAVNARKTACKAGHPLSGDNLKMRRGKRECKECLRITARRKYWLYGKKRRASR